MVGGRVSIRCSFLNKTLEIVHDMGFSSRETKLREITSSETVWFEYNIAEFISWISVGRDALESPAVYTH